MLAVILIQIDQNAKGKVFCLAGFLLLPDYQVAVEGEQAVSDIVAGQLSGGDELARKYLQLKNGRLQKGRMKSSGLKLFPCPLLG